MGGPLILGSQGDTVIERNHGRQVFVQFPDRAGAQKPTVLSLWGEIEVGDSKNPIRKLGVDLPGDQLNELGIGQVGFGQGVKISDLPMKQNLAFQGPAALIQPDASPELSLAIQDIIIENLEAPPGKDFARHQVKLDALGRIKDLQGSVSEFPVCFAEGVLHLGRNEVQNPHGRQARLAEQRFGQQETPRNQGKEQARFPPYPCHVPAIKRHNGFATG